MSAKKLARGGIYRHGYPVPPLDGETSRGYARRMMKPLRAVHRAMCREDIDANDARFLVDSLVQRFGLGDTANFTITRKP